MAKSRVFAASISASQHLPLSCHGDVLYQYVHVPYCTAPSGRTVRAALDALDALNGPTDRPSVRFISLPFSLPMIHAFVGMIQPPVLVMKRSGNELETIFLVPDAPYRPLSRFLVDICTSGYPSGPRWSKYSGPSAGTEALVGGTGWRFLGVDRPAHR